MSDLIHNHEKTPWVEAIGLFHRWLEKSERLDELMENACSFLDAVDRARLQHLLYGAVRHHLRVAGLLSKRFSHPPRHRVMAILHVAGYEIIEALAGDDAVGQLARVVHHAVEQSKGQVAPPEQKLINAVLRRLSEDLVAEKAPPALATAPVLASYYSHPEWLVKRWFAQFGAKSTRRLLEWNMSPAPVYARWRPAAPDQAPPGFLKPTEWPGFYQLEQGHWREASAFLASGELYVQDPSTRLAVDLLSPQPGDNIIDLCASPGGKTLACADRMNGRGMIVAVDLPSIRQQRLEENLARVRGVATRRVGADVQAGVQQALRSNGLPLLWPAVLIDVPCSNTGVMRHRIDVKERLTESDLGRHCVQQLRMLGEAARLVAPKGRLVYSTCSLDPDENVRVVEKFLSTAGDSFRLEKSVVATPWDQGHDGCGAFLLRRT